MLDFVLGEKTNLIASNKLINVLTRTKVRGTFYFGYPIIASFDQPLLIDALLTTIEYGVVIFDLKGYSDDFSVEKINERQDDLYAALYQRLLSYKPLRSGRNLGVEIKVVTLLPVQSNLADDRIIATAPDNLLEVLKTFTPITEKYLKFLNAAIQRVTTIKPTHKRLSVKKDTSRGGIIKRIEREIANLDQWQKAAAVELPEYPQRIRGLAGSGKTIVLALKAAYLHARNPDWNIAITFQTRSLYQQFRDLVRRFTFEHLKDEPDWDRLHILHAWGSSVQPGLYYEIAIRNGIEPKDFLYAKRTYGYDAAFDGVCSNLIDTMQKKTSEQLYDVVMIDEAQDFPHSFFEMAFMSTHSPQRIIWAYDELQNLSNYTMAPPSELFGTDIDERARIPELRNDPNEPKQDIILPICYRNTPWALIIAHSLGFGIYRDDGLIQFFDDPDLWNEIGYTVVSGQISPGQNIILKRRADSSPEYFENMLDPNDSVYCAIFDNSDDQAAWVAENIHKNVTSEELELRDILVINADPFTAKNEAGRLMKALDKYDLSAHLAGITSSVDELFDEDSIAISGIYRAKGNEAAMVYVINSDYGFEGPELIKRRNILFTAITRSRAWVRLCGIGSTMEKLKAEVDMVVAKDYCLDFRIPTTEELKRLRKIHRDMTPEERTKARKVEKELSVFVDMMERGQLSLENLPVELRKRLIKILGRTDASNS